MKRKIRILFVVFAVIPLLAGLLLFALNWFSAKQIESLKKGMPAEIKELLSGEIKVSDEENYKILMKELSLKIPPEITETFITIYEAIYALDRCTTNTWTSLIEFYEQNPTYWKLLELAKKERIGYVRGFRSGNQSPRANIHDEISVGIYPALGASVALAREGRREEALTVWHQVAGCTYELVNGRSDLQGFDYGKQVWHLLMNAFQNTLVHTDIDAPALRSILDMLNSVDVCEGYRKSGEVARCQIILEMDNVMKDRDKLVSYFSSRTTMGQVIRSAPWVIAITKPYFRREATKVNNDALYYQKILEKEPWEWGLSDKEENVHNMDEKMPFSIKDKLLRDSGLKMLVGSWRDSVVMLEAKIRSTRLALACMLYHQEKGKWPSNLSVLAPAFLESIPLDPATGEPFEYTHTNDGFSILSQMEGITANGKPGRLGWTQ